eukprot:TRINITY_DN5911_c0_g1_i1.p1 TRINITY_DN5911_c0_g1~~TRINITY_DN5911_c0_g1_i1.p1  ORF type:complete len:243 (-),score=31.83 TRINITY_DN5911_c0_g1_i1:140-823(-)
MSAPTSEHLRTMWDKFSSVWERYNEPWTLPINAQLLAAVNVYSATSILEVGCGSGAGALLCSQLMPAEGAHLTSIDISPNMVERAKAKLASSPLSLQSRIDFQVANAEELPFPDGHFDRYYASWALHLVSNPHNMMREMSRVLRSGSMVACSVWGRPEESLWFTIAPSVLQEMGLELSPGAPPSRSNFHLGDLALLRKMFTEAGFDHISTWYQPNPHLVIDGQEYVV